MALWSSCKTSKHLDKRKPEMSLAEYYSQPTDFSTIEYKGGDGSSVLQSIIIIAENSRDGIAAEYKYLNDEYGQKGESWTLKNQMTDNIDGRVFDIFNIYIHTTDQAISVYFDISSFYGKM